MKNSFRKLLGNKSVYQLGVVATRITADCRIVVSCPDAKTVYATRDIKATPGKPVVFFSKQTVFKGTPAECDQHKTQLAANAVAPT